MKRIGIGALALLTLLVMVGLFRGSQLALAEQGEKSSIIVHDNTEADELKGRPVLVSLMQNGVLVQQNEVRLGGGAD